MHITSARSSSYPGSKYSSMHVPKSFFKGKYIIVYKTSRILGSLLRHFPQNSSLETSRVLHSAVRVLEDLGVQPLCVREGQAQAKLELSGSAPSSRLRCAMLCWASTLGTVWRVSLLLPLPLEWNQSWSVLPLPPVCVIFFPEPWWFMLGAQGTSQAPPFRGAIVQLCFAL